MSHCMESDSDWVTLTASNLWLSGKPVGFGVLHILWTLKQISKQLGWYELPEFSNQTSENEITPCCAPDEWRAQAS